MSKPDGIPADIWLAAFNALNTAVDPEDVQVVIARAILAERARCANIAKLYTDFELPGDAGNALVREFVAKSIKDAATAIATSIEEGE